MTDKELCERLRSGRWLGETTGKPAAAYQALRETLVPVAWAYTKEGEQSLTSPWRVKAEGYTETPLFALPEIES